MYTQILSGICVILGVYVIGINIFLKDHRSVVHSTNNYHIGCYLNQHQINHTELIISALDVAQIQSKIITYNQKTAINSELIETKSIELAVFVDKFISDYNKNSHLLKTQIQLSKAVSAAHDSYKTCIYEIDTLPKLQQFQCQKTWIQYQNCSQRMEDLKWKISFLLSQKQSTQIQIEQIFLNINLNKSSQSTTSHQIEKQFKYKDHQLQLQQRSVQTNVKIIAEKISTVSYNYAVAQNQTLHSRMLYKECTQHQKQFRLCQQLTKQVRTLGFGTLENLGEKVQKKRISIFKIQNMANNDQSTIDKRELNILQNRSLQEYKKLHKIYIETKAKMNINCGCTAKQQQKLHQNLHTHIVEEQALKAQLIVLQQKLTRQNDVLNKIKNQRKELALQYQKKLKIKDNSQKNQGLVPIVQKLVGLQIHDSSVKDKILSKQAQFTKLQKDCQAYKQQLSSQLQVISRYSECLGKKKYFISLKQNLDRQKTKVKLDLQNKQKLKKLLSQFVV